MSTGNDAPDLSGISLARETLSGTIAKFAMAAIGFGGAIIFARIVGRTGFGGFYLILAIVEVAARPVVGLSVAVKKRFSEITGNRGEVVGLQAAATAGWLAIVCLIALAIPGLVESYADVPNASFLFVAMIVPIALFESFSIVLTGRGRVGLTKWIDALRSLLTFPAQLALVLIGLGAAGMAYGLAVATAIAVPVVFYSLRIVPSVPKRATVRSVWRFARYSVPSHLIGKTYERFDLIVLGVLLSAAAAGDYEVALILTIPGFFIAEVASEGLMARVSNLASQGDPVTEDVTNVLSYASLFSLPIFFGSLVIADPIIDTVFTEEYAGAPELLVGIALFRVIQTQNFALLQTVEGLDMPHRVLTVVGLALGANFLVGVPLTLVIGPIGVVVGTIVAEVIQYAYFGRTLRQHLPELTLLPRPIIEQVGAAIVMFVVTSGLAGLVGLEGGAGLDSWLRLVVVLASGAAVYFGLLLVISEHLRVTLESLR